MDKYIEQHKKRLSFMPWLYFTLKDKHKIWAEPWQQEIQTKLQELETVKIGKNCFISPEANIFAEPGRQITIGDNVTIAAHVFLHGPITIENGVSINTGVVIDGGAKGVFIGQNSRIASGVKIYAFNHGMKADFLVKEQAVISSGVYIGEDVWLGANACITDNVTIGNHVVVGMGAVVTKNVAEWLIIGGVPAKKIGSRKN